MFTEKARRARYWNEYMETLPREKLDALHLTKLRLLLRYAYDNSTFYRRKYDEAGLKPEDVRSLDDFKRKVPITDKTDFLHIQQERPPYGDTAALPLELVVHHCETSGTTGVPLAIPYSAYDTERYGEPWCHAFWALGIRPEDSFYFAFNWGNFAGLWSTYWGVRRFGARLISGGGADTQGHVQNILRMKPTVLCATPTYALRIAEVAAEIGHDMTESSVNFTVGGGEPGPFALPAMRAALDKAWGAQSCDQMGIAEIDAFGVGDAGRDGVLVDEMNVFCWSVDPDTGEEVPDGEIGENIVTSYVNSAQPLINYRTHDLVRRTYAGADGRTWAKLEGVILGRTDFMISVRGTNVYPTAVDNLIAEVGGVSNHYQMVLTKTGPLDQMEIVFEPEKSVPEGDAAALAKKLQAHIQQALKVRLDCTPVAVESLPRFELKTQRIVDKRPKEMRRALDR
ncbi:MAG TPA: AMP-binding protein [Alphaproteobacteria bacterium]|nr:AMP-binding protein [Alphaproteobacteria bacterium]